MSFLFFHGSNLRLSVTQKSIRRSVCDQLQTCSQAPSTHRPMRQPSSGNGFNPHDKDGLLSHICSHAPSTQRPIRQPSSGNGLRPQDNAGLASQICSHAPFTHRPIRHPSSGNGFNPQLCDWPCAEGKLPKTAMMNTNKIALRYCCLM